MSNDLPALGVGLGWREAIAPSILNNLDRVDWCELIAEHFIDVAPDRLNYIAEVSTTLPLVPHGVDLSLGTDAPLDDDYLRGLRTLLDAVDAPWHTDHLCFTRVEGFNLGQLGPLQFSDDVVDIVARHATRVKAVCQRPFLLENITYDFVVPGSGLTEAEFIRRVLVKADVGMLLDVTNLVINSTNHRYDAYEFLDTIPLDRVVQLHIAGGYEEQGTLIDSHSHPVPDCVFDLTSYILDRADVSGILLERDTNFPASFSELLDELERARALWREARARRVGRCQRRSGPDVGMRCAGDTGQPDRVGTR